MRLNDLEVYHLAREISREAWQEFEGFDWETKKTAGFQWIRAIDSIAANIAEGFGRYHYLDKNKFNYNARGSLLESISWTEVLGERGKITKEKERDLIKKLKTLSVKLNNYISATYKQSQKSK